MSKKQLRTTPVVCCIVAPCPSRYPDYECNDHCAAAGLLRLAAGEYGVSLAQLDHKSPITENPYGDALVKAGLAVHRGRGNIYAKPKATIEQLPDQQPKTTLRVVAPSNN